MNKFNLAILNNFRDEKNIKYLHGRLLIHYKNDSIVSRYLAGSLIQSLMSFADRVEKEDFMYSQQQTTVYGTGENGNIQQISSQVACLNMRFMDYMTEFIDDNVIFSKRHSQLTNTATWAFNDGLNASSRTIVQSMPRNKLCDSDTSWIDEPNMKSLNPAQDQQYKAIQVQEVTNGNKGESKNSATNTRTVKTVAETLESWRYPTRGSSIRDDPVGEIVRDRDAPKFRNQNEFPYGNSGLTSYKGNPGNSAPGFMDGSRPPPELARNPNESYQGTTAQQQLLMKQGIPSGYAYKSGVLVAPPVQQRAQQQSRRCCDNGDCGLCSGRRTENYQTRPEIATRFDKLGVGEGVYSKYSCGGECREYQHAGSCTHLRSRVNSNGSHRVALNQNNSTHGAKSGLLGEEHMDRIARANSDGIFSPAGESQRSFVFDDSEPSSQYGILHTMSAIASQDIKMARGNSLCAYVPANVTAGDGFMYQGTEHETADRGVSEDRFSGDSAEYSGEHVDRLLSTKMIQSLNNQYGDKPTPEAVSSLYDMQAGRKKATMNYGGGNMYTGGGRSQYYETPRASKISPRFTGSDGVEFMKSEGFSAAMQDYNERGVSTESRTYDGNNYVNLPQNNKKLWWGGSDGFVDGANPAEMQRLLNRRVFRSWAPGKYGEKGVTTSGDSAQEQIPFWIIAAHKRNYERDVDESVGGFETDGMIRGYGKDMNELYCRIPQKYPCGK